MRNGKGLAKCRNLSIFWRGGYVTEWRAARQAFKPSNRRDRGFIASRAASIWMFPRFMRWIPARKAGNGTRKHVWEKSVSMMRGSFCTAGHLGIIVGDLETREWVQESQSSRRDACAQRRVAILEGVGIRRAGHVAVGIIPHLLISSRPNRIASCVLSPCHGHCERKATAQGCFHAPGSVAGGLPRDQSRPLEPSCPANGCTHAVPTVPERWPFVCVDPTDCPFASPEATSRHHRSESGLIHGTS